MINTPAYVNTPGAVSNPIPKLSTIEWHGKSPPKEKHDKKYHMKKYVETISRKPPTTSTDVGGKPRRKYYLTNLN